MKLERLEKALQAHIEMDREREAVTPGSLEYARSQAYSDMNVDAWQNYLQKTLDIARARVMDEVFRSELPETDKAWLVKQHGK